MRITKKYIHDMIFYIIFTIAYVFVIIPLMKRSPNVTDEDIVYTSVIEVFIISVEWVSSHFENKRALHREEIAKMLEDMNE